MESTYSAPWAHPSSLLSGKPRKGENAPQTARSAQAQLKTAIEAANIELARLGIEPICESACPTPCAAPMPRCEQRCVTTRSISLNSLGTAMRRSRSACTREPLNGVSGLLLSTLRLSTRR